MNKITVESALLAMETTAEATAFVRALLSERELSAVRHRLACFQMILNESTQQDVRKEVGVANATATRAATTMRNKRHKEIVTLLIKRAGENGRRRAQTKRQRGSE
jgi:uncharacterized protein YerC